MIYGLGDLASGVYAGGSPGGVTPGGVVPAVDPILERMKLAAAASGNRQRTPGPNWMAGGNPDLAALIAARGAPPVGSRGPGGVPFGGNNRAIAARAGLDPNDPMTERRLMAYRMGIDPNQMMFEDALRRAGIDPRTVIRTTSPMGLQGFGTASVGSPGQHGENQGGFAALSGMSNAIGVDTAGFNAMGTNLGGTFDAATGNLSPGFNASPNAENLSANQGLESLGPTVGFGPDIGQSAPLAGEVGPQTATVSSTGVVSVGGQVVGVVAGSEAATAAGVSGGVSGSGEAVGMGGIAGPGGDASSNAGIGGPGGTGVTGGAGDAGQGTGGPGEGDQFGNQYLVPGRGPPDSRMLNLRVSPGELVTVTPPGRGLGLRDPRGKDRRSGIGELETILRHMMARSPQAAGRSMMPTYLGGGRYGQVPATPEWLAEQERLRLIAADPVWAGTQQGGGGNSQGAADSASAVGGSLGT